MHGDYLATEYGLYKGSLEPGDYVVRARLGEASAEQKLKIEAGQVYAPVFDPQRRHAGRPASPQRRR